MLHTRTNTSTSLYITHRGNSCQFPARRSRTRTVSLCTSATQVHVRQNLNNARSRRCSNKFILVRHAYERGHFVFWLPMLCPSLHDLHFFAPCAGQFTPVLGTPFSHLHSFNDHLQHAAHTYVQNSCWIRMSSIQPCAIYILTCTLGFLVTNAVPSITQIALLCSMHTDCTAATGFKSGDRNLKQHRWQIWKTHPWGNYFYFKI